MLWLAIGLLPVLAAPRPQASSLPPCCQGEGAHKCFMRQAANAATVVTVACNAARPKVAAGADFTTLHPAVFRETALSAASREPLPRPVLLVSAAVFGVRSSRAPPRLS